MTCPRIDRRREQLISHIFGYDCAFVHREIVYLLIETGSQSQSQIS
jgi:hypothetical protein